MMGGDDSYTVLGKGLQFKGDAHFENTTWIDSFFEGEINSDDLLIIGEHAVIKGNIVCNSIISSGHVMGDITATTKVELLKPAVLVGNVHSSSFSIEEGVKFRGCSNVGAVPTEVLGGHPQFGENGGYAQGPFETFQNSNEEQAIPDSIENLRVNQPDWDNL